MRSFLVVSLLTLSQIAYGQEAVSPCIAVTIFEDLHEEQLWSPGTKPILTYQQSSFAFIGLPKKYIEGGLIADRSNPFLVRAVAKIDLPEGPYELLLRSKNLSRLYVDDALVLSQDRKLKKNADGHEEVPELPAAAQAGMRPPPPAHVERITTIELRSGIHTFRAESIVGGKGLRAELGEFLVAIAPENGDFTALSPETGQGPELTQSAWDRWRQRAFAHLNRLDTKHRREASLGSDPYWETRHQLARSEASKVGSPKIPQSVPEVRINNDIDRFVASRLAERALQLAPLTDDLSFLRRVSLDTIGVIPSLETTRAFLADEEPGRRTRLIDRLLDDPGWADHWVGYWQDVLAENPNILKPSLNNTGPFRWWIYESFLDNKPLDRFATELIMMRGSRYSGGPAGFGMATQNDVPEANKALILSRAFLAANLNCARCHDSPINDFTQKQLFNMAAMLKREAIKLPKSSTVALDEAGRRPAISVSLSAGDQILPHWPLAELAPDDLPPGILRDAENPRESLAAIVTSPRSRRFARVMANRIWHRYFGRGLIEPIDEWDDPTPSHPQLLDYLVHELMSHGYDAKHIARLILNSDTYQRTVLAANTAARRDSERWYASATRRRLSAEQILDSLFSIAKKDPHAERLTMDPEGRRPISAFLNLGVPQRAWQFSSLSNERDRPALSLPVAQSVNDLLKAFGWRESRQDPSTIRDETVTPLQPLVLCNGVVGRRIVGLSDDHAVTEMCLSDVSLVELVDSLFLRFYTREPTRTEREAVIEVLADGFTSRANLDAAPIMDAYAWQRHPVSWSNHLHTRASQIMIDLERRSKAADPSTLRLNTDWRKRMEDVLWAMVNSPEFVFVP